MVVIDANEACIGVTVGERVDIVWHDTSMVPRKHHKGGQSAQRFARGRDEALKGWLRKVAEKLVDQFTRSGNMVDIDIVVGGPGMTKDRFVKELPGYVYENVSAIKNCGYTDENGLWELLGKSRYR